MESSSQVGLDDRCGDEAKGDGFLDGEVSEAWREEMPRRRRGKLRRDAGLEEGGMLPERRRLVAEGVIELEGDG